MSVGKGLASRLNSRVTIRRSTSTRKPNGGYEKTWSDVATVAAEVVGLNGREAVIAQALQGASYYRVTIRYRSDFGDADQLRYGEIDLNIRSVVDPDGRREQLQILADTGAAQATT